MYLNFRKLLREDKHGNNTVMANFLTESNTNFPQIFIREFLQNVLDNRIKTSDGDLGTATVKINLVEITDQSGKDFLDGIFDQKAMRYINLADENNTKKNADGYKALVLEEFNTSGIIGRKDRSHDQGNWAKFWHHQDDGNKQGSKNGRAGQGKITYNMMSKVWTVFGLTNEINNPGIQYLMGQCILPKFISDGDNAYKFHAFISDYKNIDNDPQPIPFEDGINVTNFRKTFSISRTKEEFGTSWVIPFPKHEPNEKALIIAIIKGYFYSIIKKRLIVYVGNTIINSDSISVLADKYKEDLDANYYDFVRESLDVSTEYQRIKIFDTTWTKSRILAKDFINDEIKATKFKDTFNAGKIAYIRMPIYIQPKDSEKVESYIDIYLQSNEKIHKSTEAFIRSDLFIAGEQRVKNAQNLYALIVAEDDEVAAFLACAEEPNHMIFNGNRDRVTSKYKYVPETLKPIRNSASMLYNYLIDRDEGRSEDLLLGLLSIKRKTSIKKKRKQKNEKKIKPIPPSKPKYFKITGGDNPIISRGEIPFEDFPVRITIEAGYEQISGNPFKDHHPFDFNFLDEDSISFDLKNMEMIDKNTTPNKAEFQILEADFFAKLSGFDENRRLRIRGKSYE